jgi:hypothetical protein
MRIFWLLPIFAICSIISSAYTYSGQFVDYVDYGEGGLNQTLTDYDLIMGVSSNSMQSFNASANLIIEQGIYYLINGAPVTPACSADLGNTSWSSWINITCLPTSFMNQSRSLTQYDMNYCGSVSNDTFYEYRATEACIFSSKTLHLNFSQFMPFDAAPEKVCFVLTGGEICFNQTGIV